jgi:glycosyltransferase involved in cell wall biosynthesis
MNCNEPLVSIGVPVYNGERFVSRSLNAILAQTYKNYEVIISDNGSTDATNNICQEFAAKDSRIKLSRNETNQGAYANFMKVLKLSQGKYFAWAAADDQWAPEFLSSMVEQLEHHPAAGVSFCAVERTLEDGTVHDRICFEGDDNPNEKGHYEMARAILSPRKYNLYVYGLFRAAVFKRAIESPPCMPDWDRWLILHYALATRFRYVNRPLHVRIFAENRSVDRGPKAGLASLSRLLFGSPVIPLHRKSLIPLLLVHYARWQLWPKFVDSSYKAYKEQFPPPVRKWIQAIKRKLLPH